MSAVPTNNSGSFNGMDAAQMAMLLYQYSQANKGNGNASDAASNASSHLTGATARTGNYQDAIAAALEKMYANGNGTVANVLPSTNGGGAAYTGAAKYGDPSQELLPMLGTDRANMLRQLMQANDLTTRQVDIGDYSVKNVQNMADRKFSSLAPSVDRAAAIAGSQGFSAALNHGVADSTQAGNMQDELTRKFGDVYSKLRQQSDDSALADNAVMYQSYLSGKGQQVNQNNMLGTLATQLFGQTAQTAGATMGNYTNSGNAVADRMLRALSGADSASVQNSQVNNAQYAPLLAALVNLNQQGLVTAQNRFTTAGQNAGVAATNQGNQLANVVNGFASAPWFQNMLKSGWNSITAPSVGGDPNYGNEGRYKPDTGGDYTYPAVTPDNEQWDSSMGVPNSWYDDAGM
jgi:hypothetical protein